jgi:hypothetical protein
VTRVVAVGYAAHPFVPGGEVDLAFPAALARDDLDALVDLTAEALEADDDVLVVYPAWSEEPTLQRLRTVRAALGTERLAAHASALPPLAGGVLASSAASLARGAPSAGALAGVLPRLERRLIATTWLSRLSGVREPAPTVVQHAASLLPGIAYAALSWPEPSIRRIRRDDPPPELPTIAGEVGVALSVADGDATWLRTAVVGRLRGAVVTEVEPTPLTRQWWGAGGVVESVLHPLDVLGAAADVSRGLVLHDCPWCARQIAADPCPYCGLAASEPQTADAAS